MMGEIWAELMELPGKSFAYAWVLWFLLVIPFLLALEWIPWRRRKGAMIFSKLSALRAAGVGWRRVVAPTQPLLRALALALIVIAIARPQTPERERRVVEGIDIYMVLDLSGSMQAIDLNLAQVEHLQSLGETPQNRFEAAKEVLRGFIEERRDRCSNPTDERAARCDRIGMVVFGESAFLEFPLTLDYGTILTLLSQRKLGDIGGNGTAIGNAVARAVAGLRHSEARSKVVVLITDGDRRGGDITPAQGAMMAEHFGIKVFPILVGREGPTLLPLEDKFGMGVSYQHIEFPVNPDLLIQIAEMTNGTFYRATNKESLRKDLHRIIDQFELTEIEGMVNVSPTEHYLPFITAALLLLALEVLLGVLVVRRFP